MNFEIKLNNLRRFKNLVNHKFGKLTVINGPINILNDKSWKQKQRKWLCKCECGVEVIRVTNQLNKGSATSCGCESKERVIRLNTQNCRPYEWIYNNLIRCANHNNKSAELTFEDFLEFTQITNCHYCNDTIQWKPRNSKKDSNNRYYIDRKNNDLGYTKSNCVVCCSLCNLTKNKYFTYEEMLILGKSINTIKKNRMVNHISG